MLELLQGVHLGFEGTDLELLVAKCSFSITTFLLELVHLPLESVHLLGQGFHGVIRLNLLLFHSVPVLLHHVQASDHRVLLLLELVLDSLLLLDGCLALSDQLVALQLLLHRLLIQHRVEAVLRERNEVLQPVDLCVFILDALQKVLVLLRALGLHTAEGLLAKVHKLLHQPPKFCLHLPETVSLAKDLSVVIGLELVRRFDMRRLHRLHLPQDFALPARGLRLQGLALRAEVLDRLLVLLPGLGDAADALALHPRSVLDDLHLESCRLGGQKLNLLLSGLDLSPADHHDVTVRDASPTSLANHGEAANVHHEDRPILARGHQGGAVCRQAHIQTRATMQRQLLHDHPPSDLRVVP
mmetsp:Transcript_43499/g.124400  ORF Transcript_43499/g.124400 Transcript_43499/m.124400 type:complete len:356 (-) Transcript_43499:879-1946(-)